MLNNQAVTRNNCAKNCSIRVKNKKVMAKNVPSASGQLRDMKKLTFFLNCHIVLSFRDRIFLFLAVCTQCCWQPMQIILIHQKRYGFFQNEILQKLRRRHRDVGIGTFCRGTFCNILTNLNVLIDKSYD